MASGTAALVVLVLAALEVEEDAPLEVSDVVVVIVARPVEAVVCIVIDWPLPLLVIEAVWLAIVVDATPLPDFPVVVVAEVVVDDVLTTMKPWRSSEDSLEKISVAMPAGLPEHLLFVKRSILISVSPWASILNRWPLGLLITMQSLGPWPDWLCFLLSGPVHVISHAPIDGRRESVETARGRRVDHFIVRGGYRMDWAEDVSWMEKGDNHRTQTKTPWSSWARALLFL